VQTQAKLEQNAGNNSSCYDKNYKRHAKIFAQNFTTEVNQIITYHNFEFYTELQLYLLVYRHCPLDYSRQYGFWRSPRSLHIACLSGWHTPVSECHMSDTLSTECLMNTLSDTCMPHSCIWNENRKSPM